MDGQRFDVIARQVSTAQTRRSAVRIAVGVALGAVTPWLLTSPQDVAARRHACEVRCGADRRFCKADCRLKGSFERQCKRDCRIWRDQCFERCQFKSLNRRLVR